MTTFRPAADGCDRDSSASKTPEPGESGWRRSTTPTAACSTPGSPGRRSGRRRRSESPVDAGDRRAPTPSSSSSRRAGALGVDARRARSGSTSLRGVRVEPVVTFIESTGRCRRSTPTTSSCASTCCRTGWSGRTAEPRRPLRPAQQRRLDQPPGPCPGRQASSRRPPALPGRGLTARRCSASTSSPA